MKGLVDLSMYWFQYVAQGYQERDDINLTDGISTGNFMLGIFNSYFIAEKFIFDQRAVNDATAPPLEGSKRV